MTPVITTVDQARFVHEVADALARGARFVDLSAPGTQPSRIRCLMRADDARAVVLETEIAQDRTYPALSPTAPAAAWYERVLVDVHGLAPRGVDAPAPLIHTCSSCARCRALLATGAPEVSVLHYGPVRSGINESIGYLIHSPGEEILTVEVALGYKRRDVEARFAGSLAVKGAPLAERIEGQASVAWAIAYATALEGLVGLEIPEAAWWWRILHAELERLAAHLDVLASLCEAGALGVAAARFAYHKERVQQLRGRLAGHRFGRTVVVPGGVTELSATIGHAALAGGQVQRELVSLLADLTADEALTLRTASFIDRIRGAGPLPRELVERLSATGVPARGSGLALDARTQSAPYRALGFVGARTEETGDGLARVLVRFHELRDSIGLVMACCERLGDAPGAAVYDARITEMLGSASGESVASFEAPQGEAYCSLALSDGSIDWISLRSGSFANLALLPQMFVGDIFTDFAFNEAGLECSVAGAAR